MGIVYLAKHLDLRRRVAIKVLGSSHFLGSLHQQRFASEMRTVAGLRHPNIVTAFDAGHCPGAT